MGTNYYKVIPIKREIKERLKEKIEKEDFYINECGSFIINNIDEIGLEPYEIHIGKNSAGWKFLFDYNEWKYFKSEETLLNWLRDNSDGSCIKDEYGEIIDTEDFIKMVNKTYDEPWFGKERYDGASYDKEHPSKYPSIYETYIGKYRVSIKGNFC